MKTSSAYRTRQSVGLLPAIILLVVVVALIGAAIGGQDPVILLIVLPIVALIAWMAWTFSMFEVTVAGGAVEWSFRGGFLRKRIALADIAAVTVVRNPWWYGWGIRLTPRGWLYNLRGFGAVEITTHAGRRTRLGSDNPARLAEAITLRRP